MEFLSQPRKALKQKKKSRKRKMDFISNQLILPNIISPNSVKNSLLNITKAKIYGIEVDNFPKLKEQKEKYREFKKKIKQEKLKLKQKKMFSRTVNNSPDRASPNDYTKTSPKNPQILPHIKSQNVVNP